MRKLCGLFLLLAMLLFALPAPAEESVYSIGPLQSAESRVKLRRQPSTDAEILGQYFSGVEVSVESRSNGWAKVKIGGRSGYMMDEFLRPAAEGDALAVLGDARFPDADGKISLYAEPSASAREILRFDPHAAIDGERSPQVFVLGTIDDSWLHVALERVEGGYAYGYASALQIVQADDFAKAVVNSGAAGERVNIREAPSRNARILGAYYSGVEVSRLFDNHVADDGWERVRVGSVTGYIQGDYLDDAYVGAPDYRPPLTALDRDAALYADAGSAEAMGLVSRHDPCCVLGVFGDRYQVRVETWLTENSRGYEYGFIAIADVKQKATKSAETRAIVRNATSIYWQDGKGGMEAIGTLDPGATVNVDGAVTTPGDPLSEYVYPEAEWLFVEAQLSNGAWASGYVPIADVIYDPGLDYSEIMTLG